MGLDVSHEAWHGAYSSFHRFRMAIAKVIGLDLESMQGYHRYVNGVHCECAKKPYGVSWDLLKHDAIFCLLNHSDCEGSIPWELLADLAKRLDDIAPLLAADASDPESAKWSERASQFANGCRKAIEAHESLEFH